MIATERHLLQVMYESGARHSQAELVELTGLSQPSVSRVLKRLERSGMLHIWLVRRAHAGRPTRLYALRPEKCYFAGVVADDTGLEITLLDFNGDNVRLNHRGQLAIYRTLPKAHDFALVGTLSQYLESWLQSRPVRARLLQLCLIDLRTPSRWSSLAGPFREPPDRLAERLRDALRTEVCIASLSQATALMAIKMYAALRGRTLLSVWLDRQPEIAVLMPGLYRQPVTSPDGFTEPHSFGVLATSLPDWIFDVENSPKSSQAAKGPQWIDKLAFDTQVLVLSHFDPAVPVSCVIGGVLREEVIEGVASSVRSAVRERRPEIRGHLVEGLMTDPREIGRLAALAASGMVFCTV